ncbi:rhodanese family domain-containing protein [Toxoplasma gondii TgCatPRC2]|uniref:Rhodanese family domain-containing protein n=11 Tax=Toxoplasma gondii TaxID=5811 RepID=A0A125YLX5_TOXGV|nr:rhodanese family domain-containing protein [Toxoplasma gondii ME49]EPR57556.1 rhodanese family domain-containing protein [Toxoplasma gondii GT1]ESS29323.1 rhodanese family domain-containing protein [Toxoplasma gondii VEG]KAF4646169.1 rhodanese family domain-containing protein [Toxoplasma gondii]KFG35480.1 rhodanese family domain-containing protein [Toxoplasma gondii p89]KFH14297.1 rhodanese family domain-containing protein [Toxoplasma gondii MAS]KYF39715.1 rhodanese family domain-containin|eukprot:XP_018638584.1 rhodanese family domain-containing protein [Toxoplasma gondii ME49]
MSPRHTLPAERKHPGPLEDPRAVTEAAPVASESPSPINVHQVVTRSAPFRSQSPSSSHSCPQMNLFLVPDLGRVENAGSTRKEEETSPFVLPPQTQAIASGSGKVEKEPHAPEASPALSRTGSVQQTSGYSWAPSSVSSGEVVEFSRSETKRCSAADVDNDGDVYLAYVPVKVCRHGSDAEGVAHTLSGQQPGDVAQQLEDDVSHSVTVIDGIDKRPTREKLALNREKDSSGLFADRLLPANHPPPLLQEAATTASPPADTDRGMAMNGSCGFVIKAPQGAMTKMDSVISMATSSDEDDRATPDIDLVALAERVGASPAQAKAKLASALQNSHKPKHGSAGVGVAFAAEPEISTFNKPSYPTSSTDAPVPGEWRRRSSALAFEARRVLSEPENSLSPPRDPTRKPSPPRTPGKIRSLSLSVSKDVQRQLLKQQQEDEEEEASEESKKAMKRQQWRRRTTVSHLTIPNAEGGLQENEGAARLTQPQHSIKEGDAADAIGIRSSTTREANPGGWKRRGSALAEKAVFQQGTLPTFDSSPPPATPGRTRTLSLFIPSDVKRTSEEQHLRDEKQEEVFTQLQAQQKEIQRQLEQQAEQYRQQMQQQQDLLEAILRQQRQLGEKEKHIEEQRQELERRQREEEVDDNTSPQSKSIVSPAATRHTLTGAQRQQLHEHLKQLEYLHQNRPRASKSVPSLEKDGKEEGGSPEHRTPEKVGSEETKSGRGRSSVAGKTTNQFSILDRVHRYLMEPNVLLLDVRSPQEFAAERVAGSINVPSDQFLSCLHLLPRNKETPLLVYCSDGSRAKQAASALRKLGHVNVCDAVSVKIVKHSLDGAVLRQASSSAIGKALRRQLLAVSSAVGLALAECLSDPHWMETFVKKVLAHL